MWVASSRSSVVMVSKSNDWLPDLFIDIFFRHILAYFGSSVEVIIELELERRGGIVNLHVQSLVWDPPRASVQATICDARVVHSVHLLEMRLKSWLTILFKTSKKTLSILEFSIYRLQSSIEIPYCWCSLISNSIWCKSSEQDKVLIKNEQTAKETRIKYLIVYFWVWSDFFWYILLFNTSSRIFQVFLTEDRRYNRENLLISRFSISWQLNVVRLLTWVLQFNVQFSNCKKLFTCFEFSFSIKSQ